jgi:uncharacterized membrane protein YgcG
MTKKLRILSRHQIALLVAIIIGASSCAPPQVKQAKDNSRPSPQEVDRFPKRLGLLNDYADVLDKASEDDLTEQLAKLNQSKRIETVVVLVKNTSGEPIFNYSLQLANQWRIGTNGRGVLFLVSIEDRKWRIQVSKALESVLTNDVTKPIGDRAADFFKNHEYAAGVESVVKELGNKLEGI